MASHDLPPNELREPLTNLPNRLAIKHNLERCIAEIPGRFGLLEVDMDDLKRVNDEQGHAAGDARIRLTATALVGTIREGDPCLLAHKSGDEFSIILPGIEDPEVLHTRKEEIRAELAGQGIEVSIGGCVHTPGQTAEELAEAADALMYEDKKARKREKYRKKRRIIRFLGRVAARFDISLRDLPLVYRMDQDGEL